MITRKLIICSLRPFADSGVRTVISNNLVFTLHCTRSQVWKGLTTFKEIKVVDHVT